MIHQVMVITNSGLSLFVHEFSEMRINAQLFSGFTTALNDFSTELIGKAQNIESVKMSQYQILTSKFKDFTLVLVVNKYDDEKTFESLIVALQNSFLEKYGRLQESEWNNIAHFDSFHPIVEKMCKSHLDIAILGSQSQTKSRIWDYLKSSEASEDHGSKAIENWNVLEYNFPKLPNCDISIWNLDLEQNPETLIHMLEEKRIVFILIESTFAKIITLIPIIEMIKKTRTNLDIYGIALQNVGMILKKNCEVLLNIPIFEINMNDPNTKSNLDKFIFKAVLGK